MIGYITVNKEELKVKDFGIYQAFYCGVCQDIKENFGHIQRLTLSYEMTFLAIVLSSVYDDRPKMEKLRCLFHPTTRQICVRNKFTKYAAFIGIILSYHNLIDNWNDEKSRKSLLLAEFIKKSYRKAAIKYPRQTKAVIKCVRETKKVEAARNYDFDLCSGLTGRMLAEIFCYNDKDIFNRDLYSMGFFLGKFIYLMDAYDDIEKDKKNGTYNPFIQISDETDFKEQAKEILIMMAAEAVKAFEKLPAIDYVDILRNVLYSGIWAKFNFDKPKDGQSEHEGLCLI